MRTRRKLVKADNGPHKDVSGTLDSVSTINADGDHVAGARHATMTFAITTVSLPFLRVSLMVYAVGSVREHMPKGAGGPVNRGKK